MLSIKIAGATPKGGKSLCSTCKCASIVRGQNCEEIVFCARVFGDTKYGGIVPFRVAECGSYHPTNVPWLHEMEAIAWEVKAKKRGTVGFSEGATEMEYEIKPPSRGMPGLPDE